VIRQSQLSVLIGLFVAVWFAISGIHWLASPAEVLARPGAVVDGLARSFSLAVFTVFLAVCSFDLWLWRLPLLPRWVVDRPILAGTWKAELTVVWREKDGQERTNKFQGHMVVYQTYSAISMKLLTDTSSSRLVASEMTAEKDQSYTFGAVYQATPTPEVRSSHGRMIHFGGMLLECQGRCPDRLRGHFWTDEFSRGTLVLHPRWTGRHFGSWEAAQAAFAAYEKQRQPRAECAD
jgi:hypothetical protein